MQVLISNSVRNKQALDVSNFNSENQYTEYMTLLVMSVNNILLRLLKKLFDNLKLTLDFRGVVYNTIFKHIDLRDERRRIHDPSEFNTIVPADVNVENYYYECDKKCEEYKEYMKIMGDFLREIYYNFALNATKFDISNLNEQDKETFILLGIAHTDDIKIQRIFSNKIFEMNPQSIYRNNIGTFYKYYLGDTHDIIKWLLENRYIFMSDAITILVKWRKEFDIIKAYDLAKIHGDNDAIHYLNKIISNQV